MTGWRRSYQAARCKEGFNLKGWSSRSGYPHLKIAVSPASLQWSLLSYVSWLPIQVLTPNPCPFSWMTCSGELQNAIDSENYAVAAELRNEISKLEAESLAASAKALAYANVQYGFRLGQKVRHKIFGMWQHLAIKADLYFSSSLYVKSA